MHILSLCFSYQNTLRFDLSISLATVWKLVFVHKRQLNYWQAEEANQFQGQLLCSFCLRSEQHQFIKESNISCPLFIDPQYCLTLLALLFNQENYSLCIISQCLLGLRFPHTVLRHSAVIFCAVNECWTAESWSLKSQCHLVLYMETPHPFPQRTCSSSSFIYSKSQRCHAYRSLKRRLWFKKKTKDYLENKRGYRKHVMSGKYILTLSTKHRADPVWP